ncbi:hypothetical protein PACTADRAFT_233 [Pachysolen tannophilus NRRL Y-2460]|uniref:F-box domain-containing protein n=1 Tax=Pachysolen tannophilus NRRL Y-2460 TaxID=669874 RepID=A0A1E4U1E4_PACTA|nr:hypothetical protein PACTADRAFT_233 [Pachysolen tannophilus NRRL Y-2460]
MSSISTATTRTSATSVLASRKTRESIDCKFRKHHQLIDLPLEINLKIYALLSIKDLQNYSLTNKYHNSKLKFKIFERIQTNWLNLFQFIREFNDYLKFVYKILIKNETNNIVNEWNTDLNNVFRNCYNLKILEIHLLNSSNCLKYQTINNNNNNITVLKLHTCSTNANFSLNHIKSFTKITSIILVNFNIFKEIEESGFEQQFCLSQLKALTLINCHWHWPFDLNYFNFHENHQKLEKLSLTYNADNSFIFGERFKDFLCNYKNNDLIELNITISGKNQSNNNLFPSLSLINVSNFQNLQKISLIGFKNNFNLNGFLEKIKENLINLKYLNLQLINNYEKNRIENKIEKFTDYPIFSILQRKLKTINIAFL